MKLTNEDIKELYRVAGWCIHNARKSTQYIDDIEDLIQDLVLKIIEKQVPKDKWFIFARLWARRLRNPPKKEQLNVRLSTYEDWQREQLGAYYEDF